jgi:hypothetical protein
MPYIKESALAEINHAQHEALSQSEDLKRIAEKIRTGHIDSRDVPLLERIAKKLDHFSHIVTEPGGKIAKSA